MTPVFLFIIYMNKWNTLSVIIIELKSLKMTHAGPIGRWPIWIETLDSRLFLIILFWNKILIYFISSEKIVFENDRSTN